MKITIPIEIDSPLPDDREVLILDNTHYDNYNFLDITIRSGDGTYSRSAMVTLSDLKAAVDGFLTLREEYR